MYFFFKQKTAYEMRISDWSSDVCSSDLYVLNLIGDSADTAVIDAYLENGPEMVAWLEETSQGEFLISLPSSDWYPHLPGALNFGRVLRPKECDCKKLGAHFAELRPALEATGQASRGERVRKYVIHK